MRLRNEIDKKVFKNTPIKSGILKRSKFLESLKVKINSEKLGKL